MLFRQVVEQPYLENTTSEESRYGLTKVTIDQLVVPGRRRFGIWIKPELKLESYGRHVVSPGEVGRIDLISYDAYGTVNYWWAIALANNIKNPLTDLVPGDTLIIPTREDIMEALAERQTKLQV